MIWLCKGSALTYDRNTQSTTKKKVTKIDSVFIAFRRNDKSKAICIQPFNNIFTLPAEGVDVQTYSGDGIVMRTWRDSVQYQMLLDGLNFRNNSMIWWPREFIKSCKTETIVNVPIAKGLFTAVTDISKQDRITFY
jgi:hypothetical protein